jgi:hypothetical protein
MPNPITRHFEVFTSPPVYSDSATTRLTFTVSGVDLVPFDVGRVDLSLKPSTTAEVLASVDIFAIRLAFTVTANELFPINLVDSAVVPLKFEFGADDCFAIATPHWHLSVAKRWTCSIDNRWEILYLNNRWGAWSQGAAIDNPCLVGV